MTVLQLLSDFGTLLGWVASILYQILSSFIAPLNFAFTFLKSFVAAAFSSPVESGIGYTWNSTVLAVFDNIPYFAEFKLAIFVGFMILVIFFTFRQFSKL